MSHIRFRLSGTRQRYRNWLNRRAWDRGVRPLPDRVAGAIWSRVPVYRDRINPATGRPHRDDTRIGRIADERSARYEAALRALWANTDGEETPEYLGLNRAAVEAGRAISWWQRRLCEWRLIHGTAQGALLSRAARYEAARRALCENSIAEHAAGIDEETPEYERLNHEVIEAERGLSAWRRWLIDRRVLRELDYWHRMGE